MYERFLANDPGELQTVFSHEDQKLMTANAWDYKNDSLITNEIRKDIESIGLEKISDIKEKKWIQNILWMWYHHAISCALWRYGDKATAQTYAKKAIELQPEDGINKITRLLYLLAHDMIDEARIWAATITAEPEKSTAEWDIRLYDEGRFFTIGAS